MRVNLRYGGGKGGGWGGGWGVGRHMKKMEEEKNGRKKEFT